MSSQTCLQSMKATCVEDCREGKRPQFIPTEDKKFLRLPPPVELDLHLLVAAHYSVYETALRDLSNAVSFFQANPVFDATKYATLNARRVLRRSAFRWSNCLSAKKGGNFELKEKTEFINRRQDCRCSTRLIAVMKNSQTLTGCSTVKTDRIQAHQSQKRKRMSLAF